MSVHSVSPRSVSLHSLPAMVVTCEHAGNRVPPGFPGGGGIPGSGARPNPEFAEALASHRGWDPGALFLARSLAGVLGAPLRACLTSRLLVEVNRSEGHPELFSRWSAALPETERRALVRRFHRRHRRRVEQALAEASRGWTRDMVHVGVHTFTPELDGVHREVEIGVLFDPAVSFEARVARGWILALAAALPGWRVRENEPYDGRSDGLTTSLRVRRNEAGRDACGAGRHGTGPGRYAGLELEVNQARVGRDDSDGGRARCRALGRILGETLGWVVAQVAEEDSAARRVDPEKPASPM